jgi:hypothetical protein
MDAIIERAIGKKKTNPLTLILSPEGRGNRGKSRIHLHPL